MAESGGRRNGRPAQGGRTEIKPRRFPMATRKRQPGRAAAFAFHTAIPDRGRADRLGDLSPQRTICNRTIRHESIPDSLLYTSFRVLLGFRLFGTGPPPAKAIQGKEPTGRAACVRRPRSANRKNPGANILDTWKYNCSPLSVNANSFPRAHAFSRRSGKSPSR